LEYKYLLCIKNIKSDEISIKPAQNLLKNNECNNSNFISKKKFENEIQECKFNSKKNFVNNISIRNITNINNKI